MLWIDSLTLHYSWTRDTNDSCYSALRLRGILDIRSVWYVCCSILWHIPWQMLSAHCRSKWNRWRWFLPWMIQLWTYTASGSLDWILWWVLWGKTTPPETVVAVPLTTPFSSTWWLRFGVFSKRNLPSKQTDSHIYSHKRRKCKRMSFPKIIQIKLIQLSQSQ